MFSNNLVTSSKLIVDTTIDLSFSEILLMSVLGENIAASLGPIDAKKSLHYFLNLALTKMIEVLVFKFFEASYLALRLLLNLSLVISSFHGVLKRLCRFFFECYEKVHF